MMDDRNKVIHKIISTSYLKNGAKHKKMFASVIEHNFKRHVLKKYCTAHSKFVKWATVNNQHNWEDQYDHLTLLMHFHFDNG